MMIKTARDQEVYNSYYQAGVKLAMEQLGLLKMAEEGDEELTTEEINREIESRMPLVERMADSELGLDTLRPEELAEEVDAGIFQTRNGTGELDDALAELERLSLDGSGSEEANPRLRNAIANALAGNTAREARGADAAPTDLPMTATDPGFYEAEMQRILSDIDLGLPPAPAPQAPAPAAPAASAPAPRAPAPAAPAARAAAPMTIMDPGYFDAEMERITSGMDLGLPPAPQQMDFQEYVVPRSSAPRAAAPAPRAAAPMTIMDPGYFDAEMERITSGMDLGLPPAPAPAPAAPAQQAQAPQAPAPQAPAPAAPQQVTFGRGGARNLTQAFRQLGIQGADRRQAMQRLRSQGFDPNKVRAGQTLTREQLMGGGNIGNRVFARLPGQVAARGRNVRNPTPSAATASNQTNRMISQAQRAPMQQLTSPSMRRGQTRLNYPQPGVMQSSRPNLATPARRQVSTPRMPAEFRAMAPQSAQGRPNRG